MCRFHLGVAARQTGRAYSFVRLTLHVARMVRKERGGGGGGGGGGGTPTSVVLRFHQSDVLAQTIAFLSPSPNGPDCYFRPWLFRCY